VVRLGPNNASGLAASDAVLFGYNWGLGTSRKRHRRHSHEKELNGFPTAKQSFAHS